MRRVKHQLSQVTTGFGLAGGFGATTAVLSGQAHWKSMIPVFVTSGYLMAHPERMQPLTTDHINQLGQALQAAAETIGAKKL